jgi:predicted DNA-binding protein
LKGDEMKKEKRKISKVVGIRLSKEDYDKLSTISHKLNEKPSETLKRALEAAFYVYGFNDK